MAGPDTPAESTRSGKERATCDSWDSLQPIMGVVGSYRIFPAKAAVPKPAPASVKQSADNREHRKNRWERARRRHQSQPVDDRRQQQQSRRIKATARESKRVTSNADPGPEGIHAGRKYPETCTGRSDRLQAEFAADSNTP